MEERVVLYPPPGTGHVVPMVEFGKRLINQNPSLSITVLITTFPFDYNDDATTSYISATTSAAPSIAFHHLPTLSPPRPASTYSNPEDILFDSLRHNNPNLRHFLLSLSLSSHISALIIDFFCSSALDLGHSLNIPTYFFFISGPSTLALFLNFPVIDQTTTASFRDSEVKFEIAGLPLVPATALIDSMLDRGSTYRELVNVGLEMGRSDGVILNSFEGFETRAFEALNEGVCLPIGFKTPPIYCVGPLISMVDSGDSGGRKHECLSWLDAQSSRSVVYLCFGSFGFFQKDQLREIAVGLERSGVRFMWVIRDPPPLNDISKRFTKPPEPDLDELLPVGFLDRTRDQGFVVKGRAPQKAVLAHPSVGAFVTHCGWNAVLEAVYAGVSLVAWPVYAEQRFNRLVLVEELGVALTMEEVKGTQFVMADEVERRVREIIESTVGETVRKRMLYMRDQARSAISDGGSSTRTIAELAAKFVGRAVNA